MAMYARLSFTNKDSISLSLYLCHPIKCADTICAEGLACSRHEQHGAAGHLPVNCRRQATVCSQCLVWFHQDARPSACGYILTPKQEMRHGLDLPTFDELCDSVDQKLFDNILANQDHLLSSLLPPPSIASQNYNLRTRPHSQEHPTDSNFITRILYKNTY
jgi:hypothetical protein